VAHSTALSAGAVFEYAWAKARRGVQASAMYVVKRGGVLDHFVFGSWYLVVGIR